MWPRRPGTSALNRAGRRPRGRKYHLTGYGRVIATGPHRTDHRLTELAWGHRADVRFERGSVSMDERGPDTIRGTYRALLQRGLDPAEAANVTGYLHGLPSAGIRWTVAEVEAVVQRRAAHARSVPTRTTPGLEALAIASPLPWNPT